MGAARPVRAGAVAGRLVDDESAVAVSWYSSSTFTCHRSWLAPLKFSTASMAVNIEALEYVQVARTRGERRLYVACMEILPNMLNPVLTDLGLRFGYIVLLLSGMSFLGLGVQPPDADLGSLVRENIGGLNQGALAIIIPALAIGTLTIGVNLLIDYLSSRRSRRTGGH